MSKTYSVMYKTGRKQTVVGNIVFFSGINTEVPRPDNAVYLNADEVVSVEEVPTKGEDVSESN